MSEIEKENNNVINEVVYEKVPNVSKNQFLAMVENIRHLFTSQSAPKNKMLLEQQAKIQQKLADDLAFKQHLDFVSQAHDLLNIKHYDGYIKMLNLGYKPATNQKAIFKEHCESLIDKQDYKTLEHYLNQGANILAQESIASLLFNSKFSNSLVEKVLKNQSNLSHANDELIKSYPVLANALNEILHSPGFARQTQKSFISSYKYESLREMQQHYEHLINNYPEIFVHPLKMSDFTQFLNENNNFLLKNHTHKFIYLRSVSIHTPADNQKMEEIINWVETTLPEFIRNNCATEINHNLKKSEKILQTALEDMALKKAQLPIVTALPQVVRTKVHAIEEIYLNLKNTKNGLIQPEDDFTVENIFEKRVPEVLEKYLRIPEEYRAKAMHETTGKTAYDMMMESLDNYHEKLKTILDNTVQLQLSDMNATKIYSKKIM